MSVEAILAFDLRDKSNMEAAKEKLEHAKEYGIDRVVWEIYGSNTNNFPNYDGGFFDWLFMQKREYKSSQESEQNYVSRLIENGQIIQANRNLYIVQGSLGLDFELRGKRVNEAKEKIKFYDVGKQSSFGISVDLEDVEGIVTVRNHIFGLDYKGWNMAKNLPLSSGHIIDKPDKIIYQS